PGRPTVPFAVLEQKASDLLLRRLRRAGPSLAGSSRQRGYSCTVRVTPDPLTRLGRYENPAMGISEEFLALPDASAAAILSSPLEGTRALGFVVCRSPGPEQGPLRRLEALVARTLAAGGFPVLRVRRNGENE